MQKKAPANNSIWSWDLAVLDKTVNTDSGSYRTIKSNLLNYLHNSLETVTEIKTPWVLSKPIQNKNDYLLNHYYTELAKVSDLRKKAKSNYLKALSLFDFGSVASTDLDVAYTEPDFSAYTSAKVEEHEGLVYENIYSLNPNDDFNLRDLFVATYIIWDEEQQAHKSILRGYILKLRGIAKAILRLCSSFKINLRRHYRNIFHFLFKMLDDESSENYLLSGQYLTNYSHILNKFNK